MSSLLASTLCLSVCEVRWQKEMERDERDGDERSTCFEANEGIDEAVSRLTLWHGCLSRELLGIDRLLYSTQYKGCMAVGTSVVNSMVIIVRILLLWLFGQSEEKHELQRSGLGGCYIPVGHKEISKWQS